MRTLLGNENKAIYGAGGTEITDTEKGCTTEEARNLSKVGIQRAHSVGAEAGGPGLPLIGWSTTGGDLRVPHFMGLHGLQVLPLIGFLLTAFRPGHRMTLVWTRAISYLVLVVLLTWQALRGQPLITLDAATLGALLARRTIHKEKSP